MLSDVFGIARQIPLIMAGPRGTIALTNQAVGDLIPSGDSPLPGWTSHRCSEWRDSLYCHLHAVIPHRLSWVFHVSGSNPPETPSLVV
jgi:hypothetical protein